MILLSPIEARVLGCLFEKSMTTPESYPLTLNSLTNACNQKSSRDPVMSLEDMEVLKAVARLRDANLIVEKSELGSRVPKYVHRFENLLKSTPAEQAALCVLFLRGPQTPGEIRSRSGRLYEFKDPAEVETIFTSLMTRADGPFVVKLPRQTGHKENRYAHLFCGDPGVGQEPEANAGALDVSTPSNGSTDRLARLEKRIEELERIVEDLRKGSPSA